MLTISTQLFKFKNRIKHTIAKIQINKIRGGGGKKKNKQINKHIWLSLVNGI